MKTVHDLVREGLTAMGADGLVAAGVCGCGLDDLAPCGDGPFPDCAAAKRHILVPNDPLFFTQFPELVPGDAVYLPLEIDHA